MKKNAFSFGTIRWRKLQEAVVLTTYFSSELFLAFKDYFFRPGSGSSLSGALLGCTAGEKTQECDAADIFSHHTAI